MSASAAGRRGWRSRLPAPVVATLAAALLGSVTVVAAASAGGSGSDPAAGPDTADGATSSPPHVESPLAGCARLRAPPPEAPAPATPAGGDADAGARGPLPELELSCVTGGEPVALDRLPGPAVVNLWASWCYPCREELPVLQRFADRTAGRVHVVGVVTSDTRTRAAAFAGDAGLTFPMLYDPDGHLLAELPTVGLPKTLFVDANGTVRHLHQAPLDADTLTALAAEHLRVDAS